MKLAANLNAAGFKVSSLATPTASGDAATKGYVDGSGFGLLGMAWTADPRYAVTSAASGASNRAYAMRVMGSVAGATKLRYYVAAQMGNMSLAVYGNSGSSVAAAPGTRKVTTGAFAVPAVGVRAATITATDVADGDWIVLSVDNVMAQFGGPANALDPTMLAGLCWYQNTAHPAPTTFAATGGSGKGFYVAAEA